MSAKYVVGIDLGTTHCAVAASPIAYADVQLFEVPQLVASGEVASRRLLPSFLYLPVTGEFPEGALDLPWPAEQDGVVGELAQRQGARAPTRFVASAKSWICHGAVDRRAPILPWSAPEGAPKISPFEASTRYLAHLRAAWDTAHPDAPLPEQEVVVTVPASFDGAACELTLEAAVAAGLPGARLLEEPQAAFYDFLGAHSANLSHTLRDARLVLVVDVGGGTTDLTLVRVKGGEDGAPEIERIAVGGHLVLGGDNMDAALAHYAQKKAQIKKRFDPTEWAALVQSARIAKERLLAADAPEEAVISIQRRGARLIGGTKSVRLSRDEVQAELVDGFMPLTDAGETAQRKARAGLTTLGLPYVTDPAIPRHINSFLRRHAQAAREAGARVVGDLPQPDLLLLNGGVFNAPALVERLQAVFAGWFGAEVPLLDHTALDAAVAQGAARFALSRHGIGKTIGGGTARAYYIGVDDTDGQKSAFCVAPRGMEDGAQIEVRDRVFDLLLGRAVQFPLYMYTGDRMDEAGAMVAVDDELDVLPALQTAIHADGKVWRDPKTGRVPVRLTSGLTEAGTLELSLATVELPPRKWRLEFALSADTPQPLETDATPPPEEPLPDGFGEACSIVDRTFNGSKSGTDEARAKQSRRKIESLIGPRGEWSSTTCRQLLRHLLATAPHRARTPKHELAWLRLVGWCLRPGFGAPRDAKRVDTLWQIFEPGLQHPKDKALWADWWVLWRRVAAGLSAERQQQIFESVAPWMNGGQAKTGHRPYGHPELIKALANFERLAPAQKVRAGGWFLQRQRKVGTWVPLGRLGARVSFHGDAAEPVEQVTAEKWLGTLLEQDWQSAVGAPFGAVLIARSCGDASRDVSPALRKQVAKKLTEIDAPSSWTALLNAAGGDLSSKDAKQIYGDSLPSGLRLS